MSDDSMMYLFSEPSDLGLAVGLPYGFVCKLTAKPNLKSCQNHSSAIYESPVTA